MRIMRSVSNCRLQRASAVGEINYCSLQPCHPWRMHCLSPKPVVLDTSWRLRRAQMHLVSILTKTMGRDDTIERQRKEGSIRRGDRSVTFRGGQGGSINTCLLRYGEKEEKEG